MVKLYPIFDEIAPPFRDLCSLLELHMLDPILAGRPLPFTNLPGTDTQSLYECVRQAITGNCDDREIEELA